jgi:NAD(P)-dependent dehydrogenase (short-subunit alcohol dehydrogenase family)
MLEPMPKTALITGAARRIGRAIALDLAAHGWAVAVHYRHSAAEAAEVVESIGRRGGQAVALAADLACEAEVQALLPAAAAALGRPLGCLINNASVFQEDGIATASRASWDEHLETNLRAPLVLTQALARQLPAETQGCVINILDQRVWNLTPCFLSYTVSKSALWTLTRTLALALAPRIRVNGIGPGPTLRSQRQTEDHFAAQWERVPLRHGTTPAEICDAVRFILGAPALTGQMIALDGGEHLGWAQPSAGFVPVE